MKDIKESMEGSTEAMAIAAGYNRLSPDELKTAIVGKTMRGLYRGGFHFSAFVDPNGNMEGKNHVGAHDFGTWSMDVSANTFSVKWQNGWENNTAHAYRCGAEIRFFDVHTGAWRNTFTHFELGRKSLDVFD